MLHEILTIMGSAVIALIMVVTTAIALAIVGAWAYLMMWNVKWGCIVTAIGLFIYWFVVSYQKIGGSI